MNMGAKAQKSGTGLGGLGAQTLGQKSNQTRTGASVPRRSALTDISNQNFVPDEVSQAKKVEACLFKSETSFNSNIG